MEDTKAEIMEKCTSLFSNVAKVHEINLAVATDLKELSTLIKEPQVFSWIMQAATQPLVACYTKRIDKFIAQRQVAIQAKQDKLSQRKLMVELIEMSNLPKYNEDRGEKGNKEKAPMHYMATIVWFFLKCEMCGMAPKIGNLADAFKVSWSQLSWLITAKKFKSGPSGYVPNDTRQQWKVKHLVVDLKRWKTKTWKRTHWKNILYNKQKSVQLNITF